MTGDGSSLTNGAKVLAHAIIEKGAKTIFALAGATHAPLLMEFADNGGSIVGGRHESGTVGAADGYARRTGRIGFALIVAEQGLQNAMTAIMTAAQAEQPVVIIATRFPDSWVEPSVSFSVDRHELTAPAVKFSRTVPSAERIDEYFEAACKAATEGTPGPAILVLPMDMMTAEISTSRKAHRFPVIAQPVAPISALDQAAALLENARQPIIVTDNGAVREGAAAALTRLAKMGVPVLGNQLGRGLVPEVAPLGYPWPYAQYAAAEADLVLIVGAKMSMWFGYGMAPRFAADAKFIHLDESAASIGRNVPVDLPIVGAIGASVKMLADRLENSAFTRDANWLSDALKARETRVDDFILVESDDSKAIHQLEIGAALDELLPDNRILIGDGADILNFTFGKMRVHEPRTYSDHLPLGAMGMGFPLALGFAAAEQELAITEGRDPAPTILVTGDGSVGFFLAELNSMARSGLPLTVVVSNDSKWGTEFNGQQMAYGRTINTELGDCDYAAVAAALGCKGVTVTKRSQLRSAIKTATNEMQPTLIDVKVDGEGGLIRKQDPLLGMILFEDIAH